LRAHLKLQHRDWLIELVIRLTLDAHSLEEEDRRQFREEEDRKRAQRARRVSDMGLDRAHLERFLDAYRGGDRPRLIEAGLLAKDCPSKGGELIGSRFR
jgi:hypothetical protein